MSEIEVLVNRDVGYFAGVNVPPDRTPFTIVGVPFDSTSTYVPGSRFAPARIREVAEHIEFFSLRNRLDMETVLFHDLGDLAVVPGDVMTTLSRLEKVVRSLAGKGRIPVILGGEHTIALGSVRGLLDRRPAVLVFDAHLDLRSSYLGLEVSHATVMRRIVELVGPKRVMIVGVRALCAEEYEYARKKGINYITSLWINKYGVLEVVKKVGKFMEEYDAVYISIDMDVIDPAYAPGVGNPEPEGITPTALLDILFMTIGDNVIGLDVTETCPPRDVNDITSVLAAKIVVETCATIYSRLKG